MLYEGGKKVWENEGFRRGEQMYTEEEVERAYEEFYEDVHTEFLKFGEIVNFKACRNGSSHLRGNVYVHYKSLDSAVLSYQSVNGRYFAGKQVQCEFVSVTKWKVAICGEFMKSKLQTCSRGMACNFIHCFRNPGGDYEWADFDKPPPRYWLKKMAALFGYSDESGKDRRVEQSSPRLFRSSRRTLSQDADRYHSGRSQSREIDFSRSSRHCSEDDFRSSEHRSRHRVSDRKRPANPDYKQCDITSNSREKKHIRNTSIDHGSDRNWNDMDGGRRRWYDGSDLSPPCRKGKLETRGVRSDGMNKHEPDLDENMSESNMDNYDSRGHPRSRRHRGERGRSAGSNGNVSNKDKLNSLIAVEQKKVSMPSDDCCLYRPTSTYDELTGDWFDGERQIALIYRDESPSSNDTEEYEDKRSNKRQCTHKLKNSSASNHVGRGNREVEHDSGSPSGYGRNYGTSTSSSKYSSAKDRCKLEWDESLEKSPRKRGPSRIKCHEAIISHATDVPIDEATEERGRWEPENVDS